MIDDREFERRFQAEARISIFKEDGEGCEEFVQVSTGKRLNYEMLDSKEVRNLYFKQEKLVEYTIKAY